VAPVAGSPHPRGRPGIPARADRPDSVAGGKPQSALSSPPPALSVPIALKFAGFITVLVVIVMAWQTATAMRVAVEGQDIAINESGIKDVGSLATLIDPAWIAQPELRPRLREALNRFCSASARLGVLNAIVYPVEGGEALATGKPGEERFEISQDPVEIPLPSAKAEGVQIHELIYNLQPTRKFSKLILARGRDPGQPIARVEVFLSAQRIHESREAIRDRMVLISVLSAAAAAIVSFLLAALLTYPIRTLARDMRQVSLGMLDHQSQVRSGDEIGDLARAFNHMTVSVRQGQEALLARREIEHDLDLATRIQARLLPAEVPRVPGYDIAAYYHSAREVGGDYYDFLRINDAHLGVAVADVSGKGVPASLVMTMTRSLLRLAAHGQDSPGETVQLVNQILSPDIGPGMFVTLLYFVIHLPTRRVRLVRAGHNAPLLHVARLNRVLPLQPRGIAIGLDRGGSLFRSELEVQQFVLSPSDCLVAYTDGIVEGKDHSGENYSDERLAATLQREAGGTAQSIVESVIGDLALHRKDAEQSDDITLLAIKATTSG